MNGISETGRGNPVRLSESLTNVTRIAIDTAPIIYYVEENARYDSVVTELFEQIATGRLLGVTSVISLSEVLVQPFLRGNNRLAERYRDLLLRSENFQTISIDPGAAERAAALRARYRLRTPDAVQISTALGSGCQAFLTNDNTLRRVTELRVIVLDELE